MSLIVIVSPRPDLWRHFAETLGHPSGIQIEMVKSGAAAIEVAQKRNPLAMILDRDIPDISRTNLVRQVLFINAMIHIAWVSAMPEDEFHQVTEGLGILMKLSPTPDSDQARELVARLGCITGVI